MKDHKVLNYIKDVIKHMPSNWLTLTTHRLDIYEEKLAKIQFLEQFETLFHATISNTKALQKLPTAYDYIRLGHPLSSILEWTIAKSLHIKPEQVISFSSQTIPLMAILRKNALTNTNTRIFYTDELPYSFDIELLRSIYGYTLEVHHVEKSTILTEFDGRTILFSKQNDISAFELNPNIDFFVNIHADLGSILVVYGEHNESYISEIQHVRRRETIAMTPINCFAVLKNIVDNSVYHINRNGKEANKKLVRNSIASITGTTTQAVVGSSGLSVQYAIMMGLIHHAIEKHKGKAIKFIVPTNCYGGTNDQARRVAACLDHVEVVDLAVDGKNDMVQSIAMVLDQMADEDAIPYIIAEIPTNPRVEVPDLQKLKEVLSTVRKTASGENAIDPVFILDQTFCPNIQFLGEGEILSTVRTISYASGSKFPSGGKCTAGYCVGNKKAAILMDKIELHLRLCDNEATHLQYEVLAKQMPSMNQRIYDAYSNTREFVDFIQEALPEAKINFVSSALAKQGFTPSVFSLDLPTKGKTVEEKESYKRALNLKLIHLMITEIPNESKFCVSYGQLKGCYWTIPATSTQGTTKEGDKDYIVRVALSPILDLELHKKIFLDFVQRI